MESGSYTQGNETEFVGDLELTVKLTVGPTAPGESGEPGDQDEALIGGGPWSVQTAIRHFGDLAFDRMMGWPVEYVGIRGPSSAYE